MLFGSGGDELPLLEKTLPVRILASDNEIADSVLVLFQVFKSEKEELRLDTVNQSILILTPYESVVMAMEANRFHGLYHQEVGELPANLQLISNSLSLGIPLDAGLWARIFAE